MVCPPAIPPKQHELSPDGVAWRLAQEFPELFATERLVANPEVARERQQGAAVPQAPTEEWYAHFDDSNQGPVDLKGMKNWIALGMVKKDTMIWRQGMAEWQTAELIRAEWFGSIHSGKSVIAEPPTTDMNVFCPHCQVRLSVHPSQAGSVVPCSKCGGRFKTPLPTAYSSTIQVHSAYSASTEIQRFASKKTAAGICGILLGGLGVHKFILGLTAPGTIMLVVWSVGIVTGTCLVIPLFASIAMNIIGLVEGIIYLTKTDDDFYQTYAIQKKEWF